MTCCLSIRLRQIGSQKGYFNMRESLHTISLFVANKPGVLLRVTLVFARRGFNIESLVVSSAFDGRYARMTITARGDDRVLEQIVKQLAKLVDVIEARDNLEVTALERELCLVKFSVSVKQRESLLSIVQHFNGVVIDANDVLVIAEVSGDATKVAAFVDAIAPFPVVEMVRSGKIVMRRVVPISQRQRGRPSDYVPNDIIA